VGRTDVLQISIARATGHGPGEARNYWETYPAPADATVQRMRISGFAPSIYLSRLVTAEEFKAVVTVLLLHFPNPDYLIVYVKDPEMVKPALITAIEAGFKVSPDAYIDEREIG
jgi:hypothetical protein